MNESIRAAHNETDLQKWCESWTQYIICWLAKTFWRRHMFLSSRSEVRCIVGLFSDDFVAMLYGNNRWRFLFCTCILGCDSNAQQDLSMFIFLAGLSFLRADFCMFGDNDNFIWKIIYGRSPAGRREYVYKKDSLCLIFFLCAIAFKFVICATMWRVWIIPKAESEIVARAIMKMRESVPALRH